MKNIVYSLSACLLCCLLLFSACSSDASSDILGADVVRGAHFDMPLSKIKSIEQADLIENTRNKLVYNYDLNDDEFVEIAYIFDRQSNLQKIELDAFMKSGGSAQNLYNQLKKHCDNHYKSKKKIWLGEDGKTFFTVFLKLVKDSKNPGVFGVWEKV